MPTEGLGKNGHRQPSIDELEKRLGVAKTEMHQQNGVGVPQVGAV